jgi:hypothetical protein
VMALPLPTGDKRARWEHMAGRTPALKSNAWPDQQMDQILLREFPLCLKSDRILEGQSEESMQLSELRTTDDARDALSRQRC